MEAVRKLKLKLGVEKPTAEEKEYLEPKKVIRDYKAECFKYHGRRGKPIYVCPTCKEEIENGTECPYCYQTLIKHEEEHDG